jgi:uncharacterized protein
MGTMRRLLGAAMMGLLLTPAGAARAGALEDGFAAYNRGEYAEAVELFQLAAARHEAAAQFDLGQMYRKGLGVTQDHAEAARWYRLAAAQGHVAARYNLGLMYLEGLGVTRDQVRAYMWLDLSGEGGHPDGMEWRDKAAATMTPQQIEEARERVRECQMRESEDCD